MITITKKQSIIAVAITALAVVMTIAPPTSSSNGIKAFAWGDGWDGDGCGDGWDGDGFDGHDNFADQGINQHQGNHQDSQIVSGGDTIGSGSNFSFQNEDNFGNNALAQR